MITLGCRWLKRGHFQIGLGIHYGGEIGYGVALYVGLVVLYAEVCCE